MAQLFDLGSNFGQRIGSTLGTGLGAGLEQLAHHKLSDMLKSKQASAFQNIIPGLSEEDAKLLISLPPEIQKAYISNKLDEPSKQAFAQSLNSILGTPGSEAQQESFIPQGLQSSTASVSPVDQVSSARSIAPIKGGLNQKQALDLADLALKKQGIASKEEAERFKASAPYREKIIEGARAARQDLKDLDRLEELQSEGKLDTPGYNEFLKRSGFDIGALRDPSSEEFQKIEANFLRNAKQYFGGRISNYEVEQFLKTIPNLSLSNEGRKRVIANLKYVSRAALEYNNALKEVIKENKGIPPYDLAEQIDDKIESKLDKLSEKFREDLAKPVPKEQNRLVTALQATLGSAINGGKGAASSIGNAANSVASIVGGAKAAQLAGLI